MSHIHSCMVTYNRLDLTKRAIDSYIASVTGSWSMVVVDNGSTDGTPEWLAQQPFAGVSYIALPTNRYPGFACNLGWAHAPEQTTLLHRADNDFVYLDGWCDEVRLRMSHPPVGQLGLRTNEEELWAPHNVGGNNVIRRELWDKGLRYDERPWSEFPTGYTEDSMLSPAVRAMGYAWTRVKRPCIVPISSEDAADPYYQETWAIRGIQRP